MSDYKIKLQSGAGTGTADKFFVCRPGEDAPSFIVRSAEEALSMIELDRAQPAPLNRCVGCVEGECPCLPV